MLLAQISSGWSHAAGGDRLDWQSEMRAGKWGRIDIVGFGEAKGRAVAVEAKIHHTLSLGQLAGYSSWLHEHADSARKVVVLLVPQAWETEAAGVVSHLDGAARVITWEDVFEALAKADLGEGPRVDLGQMQDLYQYVEGSYIAPFSDAEVDMAGAAWADR